MKPLRCLALAAERRPLGTFEACLRQQQELEEVQEEEEGEEAEDSRRGTGGGSQVGGTGGGIEER